MRKSDGVLPTVVIWLNSTLDCLHVYFETYGKVLGDLKFIYHASILKNDLEYKKKYVIDCEKADMSGVYIPMVVDKVAKINSKGSLFILLVETCDTYHSSFGQVS
jgi:DNA topoisomerase VI subunit A